MLGSALGYPRRDEAWLRTVGIGGLLVVLGGLLLLPLLPLEGYIKRVLGTTTRGEDTPPAFEDWIDLTVDGVKMYVIQIAYMLLPAVLVFIGVVIAGAGGVTGQGVEGVGLAFLLLGSTVGMIAGYLIPAAMTNFAYQDDLGAAFDIGTVVTTAFSVEYFIAFLLAVVVAVVLGLLGTIMVIVLVGIFVLFYVQVVVARLWARGYADARGLTGTA